MTAVSGGTAVCNFYGGLADVQRRFKRVFTFTDAHSLQPFLRAPLESHLARFKLKEFRPGQREVIAAILAGHDCLCIMPTGGGKSLCYQLPAVARDGLTLVVSPLIALMKDQVDALAANGVPAAMMNSSQSSVEHRAIERELIDGRVKLLFVSPERLALSAGTMEKHR